MATFKITVRYMRADGLYPVYIRVTHNRKTKFINTGKVTTKKFINAKTNEIKDPYILQFCTNKIAKYATLLNKVDARKWNVEMVAKYIEGETEDISFSLYAEEYCENLCKKGQGKTARTYNSAYRNLEKFAGTENIMFSQLTTSFIREWIDSLISTRRIKEQYPTSIRQIFKSALAKYNDYDTGILKITTNPWAKIKIPKSTVPRKKAITMEACREFFNAPLPDSLLQENTFGIARTGRDVAMMVICLAGINGIDIYKLKKEDYQNGIISYERSKTRTTRSDNAFFQIRVPNILRDVFGRYLDEGDSPYLFNFHRRYSSSESFTTTIDLGIKQICEKSLGMSHDKAYSIYTFRHTWATIAQNECGATIEEVGFALNHTNKNRITRGYIKLDFTPAWELNEKVIEKIFFTEEKSRDYEDSEKMFEDFSKDDKMKATLFYKGKVILKMEDKGFANVEQIIDSLMDKLPQDIPSGVLVLIRIENLDSGMTQEYSRMVNS